jgi:hypothetical protein
MKTSLKYVGLRKVEGFALIVSLAMITLAAVITVALLSSASTDRFNSNAYSKRARAEMAAQSGLAAALNALVGADPSDASGIKTIPNDFRFVTAAGDDNKPALIPLSYDATSGKVSLNLAAKRPLYSSSGTSATLTLSTTATPKETRPAGYISITSQDPSGTTQETERYAFYVDEGSSRQNLSVQGGSDRIYARDPNELPIVTATAAPVPFNATQIATLQTNRGLLFTPQTANPVLASNATTPAVDNYSYASAGAVANLTPEGKPRVNLLKLKDYVDTLSTDQTKGNARAALVERLLNPSESGTDWGLDNPKGGKLDGGNLSFLTKLAHYTPTQCRQIVANLLDYLDADIVPTTDDVAAPTYFGVEAKYNPKTGKTKGHPYINFIETGMILNIFPAGQLSSTRVLGALGIVNPWSDTTDPFGVNYSVEFVVEVHGTANGADAGTYFNPTFDDLTGKPIANIPPNSGSIFPANPATLNYRNQKTFNPAVPGPTFSGVKYTVRKCRLKYTSTSGTSYYVQVLDNLQGTSVPGTLSDFDTSKLSGSLKYEFTSQAAKLDLHLNTDPRINFLSNSWTLSKSTNKSPAPPQTNPALNIYQAANSTNADFSGVVPAPAPSDVTWYTSATWSSNFFVKSPPAKDPATKTYAAPTFDTAGEIGYVHTGIPWETLRLYVTGNEANGKERDKELLAYVQSGTFNSADYGSVPTHAGKNDPAAPVPLLGGPLNVNTNKKPTLASLFLGAAEVADSNATANAKSGTDTNASNLTDAVAANAGVTPFVLPTDLLALPAAKTITNGQANDFDREILARRTTNVTGIQSTRFTVYALGEARDKLGANRTTSSAVNLRAEVELQTDSNGRPIPRVLSTAYYLSN